MLRDEPLRRLLDSLPSSGDDAAEADDVVGLRRVADSLCSTPELLHGSLTSILHEEERLEEVAQRSSAHPNGFAKVVPFDAVPARLHVWQNGGRAEGGDESVAHGHRWDFASWVITGTLRETMFEIDRSGEPVSGYSYGRRDGEPFLQPSGRTGLRILFRRCRPAGCVYIRRGTDLHSAEPVGEGLVASFVVQGRRTTAPVPVYRRGEAEPPDERTLRPDELKGLLTDVVDVLRPAT